MSLRTLWVWGLPLTLVAAAPFGYSLTSSPLVPKTSLIPHTDPRKAAERLCASRSVNERLKARMFDDAAAVSNTASTNLDLLASFSEVRMDQPLLKSRDQELGVTVCTGRFVLLLPPGSEEKFGGRTLFQADVEYAAQPAADGSGLVYQLRGADSIVYRLAAYNLSAEHLLPPKETQLAAAVPVTEPAPVEPAPPAPAPEPVQSSPPVLAKAPAAPPPVQAVEAAKPAKLARAEPKPVVAKPELEKPEPKKALPKEVKLAKAEPKKPPKPEPRKDVKLAKAEPKKDVRKAEPKKVELARAEPKTKPKKAEHAKPVMLASAKPTAAEKAKPAAKPVKLALAPPKPAPAKPAAKPKPQELAAAVTKRPAKPPAVSSGTENSFLAYEQRRAAATPVVQRASANDCDGADGTEARLICANPNLAAKKRAVSNFYLSALEDADASTRQMLNRTRGQFASYLNRCSTASCLADAYDDRIAEIRDIMRNF